MEFENANEINDKLDSLESVMDSLMKKYRDENYYPSPERIKLDLIKQNEVPIKHRKAKTFWDHFNDFVEQKRKEKSDVRDYHNSLRKHLLIVESILGINLSFALISSESGEFNEEWSNYLSFVAINSQGEPGLLPNTIGKQNKNIKAFLNWCFDRNIIKKFSIKCFPTIMEDVDKVYLTDEELERIESLELNDTNEAIVRDLFLVGCETALRFSDFIQIKPYQIKNDRLYITPKKTKGTNVKQLIIPMSQRFMRIYDNYEGTLPNYERNSLTRFNKTIRLICAQANINEQIIFNRNVAGKTILIEKLKYDEVSSHTCRRTFCTLKFLKGMPAQAIMKFSGHQTERNFLKYLKLDAELTATKYKGFF
jgi:integrase